MSLRTRIAAAAALAVALAVVAVVAVTYVRVRSDLRAEVDRSLERAAPRAVALRRPPPIPPERRRGLLMRRAPLPAPGVLPPPEFGGAGGFVQPIAPNGEVRRRPGRGRVLPVDERAAEIAASGRGRAFFDQTVEGRHLRVLAIGRGAAGAIEIARPLDETDRALDRTLLTLVLVALAGVVLAAGLGLAVARTALAPVARFTRRTEEIAADPDLARRIEVKGSDEIARLAETFNATLAALERALEAQRRLVADASHELRTPIASLRANIQVLEEAERLPAEELARLRADVVAELDELTALVGDVVELARGSAPEPEPDDVRLDEIVADLVERSHRRDRADYSMKLEPTVVSGRADRIQRAVSNLLDNARKWNHDGAPIEVALDDGLLRVRDHGPGFDAHDLDLVFDRFYRAAAARGTAGSGLGLAIVRQAAEAHGGFARAENAPGGGALLTVSFGEARPVGGGQGFPADRSGESRQR